MSPADDCVQDVMQVCRNGHVVTDLLRTCPDQARPRCERCGASTIDRCLTCGRELPGAIVGTGFHPIGDRRPPCYCATCGAAFPWTEQPRPPVTAPLAQLEAMLRRLPRVIRQLRSRHADRPPFRVADERDLEDLLRALLPLHFDDVRPESRTPSYASATRMDFLLAPQRIAVTAKLARSDVREPQLTEQLGEDAACYRRLGNCRTLLAFVYDPEGVLRDPRLFENACGQRADDLDVRCVVGAP